VSASALAPAPAAVGLEGIAKKFGAYVALRDIARLRPRTPEELGMAYGIGRQKAERYGLAVLRVVAEASRADYA